jgi:hypothetical protein
MKLKEFQKRVDRCRKLIKAAYEPGAQTQFTVCSNLTKCFYSSEDLGKCFCVKVKKGELSTKSPESICNVSTFFQIFFGPLTTRGSFFSVKRKKGFDGCEETWLGGYYSPESKERRLFYLDMWEQWMIVFEHYKNIEKFNEDQLYD